MNILNKYKINRWLFSKNIIVRFTHTNKGLNVLEKELLTMAIVPSLKPEIQSLYHLNRQSSSLFTGTQTHYIREWRTSINQSEENVIQVNKGVLSITNNYWPNKGLIFGKMIPYNNTKFTEEIMQISRLNNLLSPYGYYLEMTQDKKVILKEMFVLCERNTNVDILLNGYIGMDIKSSLRILPRILNGELQECLLLKDYSISSDNLSEFYKIHLEQKKILQTKGKEIDKLDDNIIEIIEKKENINNKMDECITQIILYNGKLTREEKELGLGGILSPLSSVKEVKQLDQEIISSKKLNELDEKSTIIYGNLSEENKIKLSLITKKSMELHTLSIKDLKIVREIIYESIELD